jgi:TetR/AcrR family transcriptional regulator, transcriptional repressor for nem operon
MLRSTPKQPVKVRERLLEAAEKLMLAKGFVATTVDEICAAARVTKGSFFHYFESKEDLGKVALERFCAVRLQFMQGNPARKKADPLERILGTVDFAIEMSKSPLAQNGCLLGNFAQELSDSHPGIRSLCARRFDEWAALLKSDLDGAKAEHLPKSKLDTESLAEHFIAIVEGALILAKAKRDMGIMEKSLRHYRRYLENLFKREN